MIWPTAGRDGVTFSFLAVSLQPAHTLFTSFVVNGNIFIDNFAFQLIESAVTSSC